MLTLRHIRKSLEKSSAQALATTRQYTTQRFTALKNSNWKHRIGVAGSVAGGIGGTLYLYADYYNKNQLAEHEQRKIEESKKYNYSYKAPDPKRLVPIDPTEPLGCGTLGGYVLGRVLCTRLGFSLMASALGLFVVGPLATTIWWIKSGQKQFKEKFDKLHDKQLLEELVDKHGAAVAGLKFTLSDNPFENVKRAQPVENDATIQALEKGGKTKLGL